MESFIEFLSRKNEAQIPAGAKTCGNCGGSGLYLVTPNTVSPPSLHRGREHGGYEPNSNVKTKTYVTCPVCDGKGYRQ